MKKKKLDNEQIMLVERIIALNPLQCQQQGA